MGRMTENVQMSLSSIRRRTIWTLVMYQISFLHSIPLRRWLSHFFCFFWIRGQQFKYRGPVVHFLRDVGKIYEELPLLPNVVILHKSQSVTLSQVVCDISDVEFASGLAYVATSRASKLKGLMFDAPFDRSCVCRDPPTRAMQMKIDNYETRRQPQQLTRPLYNPLSDHSSTDDVVESGP
jgi:hypothetical protein